MWIAKIACITVCPFGLFSIVPCTTNALQIAASARNSPLGRPVAKLMLNQRWVSRFEHSSSQLLARKDDEPDRGYIDELNFFKADIPDEIRNEIFEAESNTKAGKERNERLATYTAVIVVGLIIAAFNTFLTGLQDDGENLSETMFGWIASNNPLNEFLFLNKIGGAVALVSAGVCGVLAEVELRARRENVEKIWREVRRRKDEREKGASRAARKKGKSKKSQKQRKRLAALSEVVVEQPETETIKTSAPEGRDAEKEVDDKKESASKEEGGIMGKIKDLYKKADDMAAAQALLLNKELEDRGVLDKVTDETGLKVIGKEGASKLQEEKTAKGESKGDEKK